MRKLLAAMTVGLVIVAVLVQGVSASTVCSTESVSCATALGLLDRSAATSSQRGMEAYAARNTGLANAATAMARTTGMAGYYRNLAAWGPRAQASQNQVLANFYATLPWDTSTMSTARGLGALFGK